MAGLSTAPYGPIAPAVTAAVALAVMVALVGAVVVVVVVVVSAMWTGLVRGLPLVKEVLALWG